MIYSTDGSINSKDSLVHFTKFSRGFSVAGAIKGSFVAKTPEFEKTVTEGNQIILGQQGQGKALAYTSDSFNYRRFAIKTKRAVRVNDLTRSSFTSNFDEDQLEELIISEEELKKRPATKHRDFLQKL